MPGLSFEYKIIVKSYYRWWW